MKALLSHGYFLNEDKIEQKVMMPYPPQGLLHIATYLNSKGVDCKIYDSTFKSFEELTAFLEKDKPSYLGLYVNLMTRPNILKIIRFIRKSVSLQNTVIILGGPDIRHHAELYIEYGADYCISGEGEDTILKLVTLLDKQDYDSIRKLKGLTLKREDQEIVSTGEPELISSMDDIPFPNFDLINLKEYFSKWTSFHGYNSITISTMRGCPYSCRWCSKAVFGKSFRRRSASLVVEEMGRLQSQYAPDRFWIVDDVFTISKKWLVEFNKAIQSSNLKIKYECITRADKMDKEIIDLLKVSGCFRLWVGAESGSQKVLDLMDRGVKADVVQEMIKMTKKVGIEAGTFLMLGYPGEDEKDILETVKHLKNASPDHFTITLSYPIPGTEFYNEVKNMNLKSPGEWGTYSDRDLDFQRTYKKNYYQHAIRYINHAVKAHCLRLEKRNIESLKHNVIAFISRGLMILNRIS